MRGDVVRSYHIVFGLVLGGTLAAVNIYNTGIQHEERIKASREEIGNAVFNAEESITQSEGVTRAYARDFIEARGSDDQKPMFLGRYPEISPAVYEKLQRTVEVRFMDLQDRNGTLTKAQREYEEALGQFPSGMVLRAMGFPSEDVLSMHPLWNG
jgi:hypothetical protein